MGNTTGTVQNSRRAQMRARKRHGPQKAIYIDPNTGDVLEYETKRNADGTLVNVVVSGSGERNPVDFSTPMPTQEPSFFNQCMGDRDCKQKSVMWGKSTYGSPAYACTGAKCENGSCNCGTFKDENGLTKDCMNVGRQCCQNEYCYGQTVQSHNVTNSPYVNPTTMPVTTMPVTTMPAAVTEGPEPVETDCSQFATMVLYGPDGSVGMTGEDICNIVKLSN